MASIWLEHIWLEHLGGRFSRINVKYILTLAVVIKEADTIYTYKTTNMVSLISKGQFFISI